MRAHRKYSYEHLITGSKRQVIPENNLGGIISDDMGMGKSLTMLSAIVASLAAAESFAQSERRNLASSGVRKPASKATLLVVPSACKWLLIVWHITSKLILVWNLVLLDAWIEEVQKYDNFSQTISTVANYTPGISSRIPWIAIYITVLRGN